MTKSKNAKPKPVVVALSADHHINSCMALCPPYFNRDEGGTYTPGKSQGWINAAWLGYVDKVKRAARKANALIYAVLVGDLMDYNKHPGVAQITHNRADVRKMAYQALSPLIEVADRTFILRGTEAHSDLSASIEEDLAEDIGAEMDREFGTYSWWALSLNASSVIYDITHHPDTRSEIRGTAAGKLAQSAIIEYARTFTALPHLVVRAHFHRKQDSGDNYPVRAIMLPCWQLYSPFVYRIGKGTQVPDVGGAIVTCNNGEYDLEWDMHAVRRRSPWKES